MKPIREVITWIKKKSKGRFFSLIFLKRHSKERRKMVCRVGVRNRTNGVGLKYDPKEKRLLIVFDSVKDNYRAVPIEGILSIKMDGVVHRVSHSKKRRT